MKLDCLDDSACTQLCLEMLIKQGRQGDPPHLVVPHEVCWAIAARGRPCASHGRISEHFLCIDILGVLISSICFDYVQPIDPIDPIVL